jgi:hypothetical protein
MMGIAFDVSCEPFTTRIAQGLMTLITATRKLPKSTDRTVPPAECDHSHGNRHLADRTSSSMPIDGSRFESILPIMHGDLEMGGTFFPGPTIEADLEVHEIWRLRVEVDDERIPPCLQMHVGSVKIPVKVSGAIGVA